jgi:hypothetical protein
MGKATLNTILLFAVFDMFFCCIADKNDLKKGGHD